MSILSEFKAFAIKGNVIDLAVGFVVGAAFGKIVTSFTTDILMPPIGLALGAVDFSNLFINLSSKHLRDNRGGESRGRADAEHRPVPQHHHRLSYNRVRSLHARQMDQSPDRRRQARAGQHQGMSVLRELDPYPRHAMPSLHVGTEGRVVFRRNQSITQEKGSGARRVGRAPDLDERLD